MSVFTYITPCFPATPPNSFVIHCSGHRVELAASCQEERAIWIKSLSTAREEVCPAETVKSSFQLLDEMAAMNGHSSATGTPKKRQSLFSNSTHTGEAGARKTGPPSSPEIVGSTISRTPSAIKRLSTASIASLFGPEQNSSSPSPPPRRSTPASRHLVDHNIRDIVSSSCLAARAQARMNGELFQAPLRTRTRTLSSQNQNPPDSTPRKRETVASADSFGLGKMSEESQVSRAGSGRGQMNLPLSPRRRTQSLPNTDNAPQPLPDSASRKHADALDALRPSGRRTVFDLMDEDPFFKGDSDDEPAESVWEGDDLASAAHTDFSSVETYPHDASKPNTANDAVQSARHACELDSRCDVMIYVGKGITNVPPPQRHRSLFRKSLFTLTRRGTRGPSAPDERGAPSSLHALPAEPVSAPSLSSPYRSLGSQLLSPNWIMGSRSTRPTQPSAPSRDDGSVLQKRSRSAIDRPQD